MHLCTSWRLQSAIGYGVWALNRGGVTVVVAVTAAAAVVTMAVAGTEVVVTAAVGVSAAGTARGGNGAAGQRRGGAAVRRGSGAAGQRRGGSGGRGLRGGGWRVCECVRVWCGEARARGWAKGACACAGMGCICGIG